jgi:quercetin dioxygenase-like cupin family protein
MTKGLRPFLWSLLFVALALGCASKRAYAQDPVKVAPKNVKVVFENDRVRVIEVRIKPGEKIPVHSHPANVTIALSDFKGKFVSDNGEPTVKQFKLDTVLWSEPITHASENVGSTEIHAIAIELKEPPKKSKPAAR